MNKRGFWNLIDMSWKAVGDDEDIRFALRDRDVDALCDVEDVLARFIENLSAVLGSLTVEQVCSFDAVLERTLHALDRPELWKYTQGTNDGFLYKRGFIVALGREYHDAVDADESVAMFSRRFRCDEMTYVHALLGHDRFEDVIPHQHRFDRESFTNTKAWAREAQLCI
jgi:hypothetical protein